MQTKVLFNITDEGDIYFECTNHSGDHDTCTIISTLCNVLLAECERANIEPDEVKDDLIRICIIKANPLVIEVFRAVQDMFLEAYNQHPFYIKMY